MDSKVNTILNLKRLISLLHKRKFYNRKGFSTMSACQKNEVEINAIETDLRINKILSIINLKEKELNG